MIVYQVNCNQGLLYQPKNLDRVRDEIFCGRPFPETWKQIELLPRGDAATEDDFFGLGLKALVCSEKAVTYCGQLWDEGEFLPVKIKGIKGKYYLYNITHCCSHLNPRKTRWQKDTRTGEQLIKSPAFYAERLGEDCVFKIPEDGATAIYTLERDDVPGHEGLKTLAKRYGLTGLKLKLVWSDEARRRRRSQKQSKS